MAVQYIPREGPSHWYTVDGLPMHEVPTADGFGMRPTHVGDAKRLGLLPSVTNILGVLDKPGLTIWKQNRLIEAAIKLPRFETESDDDYARRIIEYAQSPSFEASDFGVRVHAAIEHWLKSSGELWPDEPNLQPFLEGFAEWFRSQRMQPVQIEKPFAVPEEGYAGTGDLLAWDGRPLMVDWKTQKAERLTHYPEWRLQAVAYAKGMKQEGFATASVVISSTVPGKISIQEYGEETQERAWKAFLAARDLFYSPVGKGKDLPFGRQYAL